MAPLNEPSGNMYPWAFTWNPLGGKCPHQCSYCYVEGKIAPWLYDMGSDKYMGEPRLIAQEFYTRLEVPKGYVIFVQSCGDLFAWTIEESWIWQVLNYISKFRKTTFLLQTKNPERFFTFDIPQNCILGTTIETNRDYKLTKAPPPKDRHYNMFLLNNDRDIEGQRIYRLMVSLEPLLDFDLDVLVQWIQEIEPEFVSIGADSLNNGLPEPEPDKVAELLSCLHHITEVRVKDNLKRLMQK